MKAELDEQKILFKRFTSGMERLMHSINEIDYAIIDDDLSNDFNQIVNEFLARISQKVIQPARQFNRV